MTAPPGRARREESIRPTNAVSGSHLPHTQSSRVTLAQVVPAPGPEAVRALLALIAPVLASGGGA